ncbi:speckle-type POZ protein-like [Ornithodoros turicata]|uniref:speckle-type POZ protein-like n=1 Tax=Ornithodoros turicata TaxID=34597 RepID=UPI003138F16B
MVVSFVNVGLCGQHSHINKNVWGDQQLVMSSCPPSQSREIFLLPVTCSQPLLPSIVYKVYPVSLRDEEEVGNALIRRGGSWNCAKVYVSRARRMEETKNSTKIGEPVLKTSSNTLHYPVIFSRISVKHFCARQERMGQAIVCPPFSGRLNTVSSTWSVHIYPRGVDQLHQRYLSLYLVLNKSIEGCLRVAYTFNILNIRKGGVVRKRRQHVFKEGDSKGISKFMCLNRLTRLDSEYLANDTLTLYTEIMLLPNGLYSAHLQRVPFQLPLDFGEFIEDTQLSDFTFVVQDTEFKAHRIVLAYQSQVFSAMVRHSGNNRTASITDISPDTFRELLRFIYTGSAPNLDKNADKLLIAADKYLLNDLKKMCECSLYNQLSTENCLDTLLLAHYYACDYLKLGVMKFIIGNRDEIKKINGWKSVNLANDHNRLVAQILDLTHAEDEYATMDGPPRKRSRRE